MFQPEPFLEKQQEPVYQSRCRTRAPVRIYQQNKLCKDLIVTNEENELFTPSNNLRGQPEQEGCPPSRDDPSFNPRDLIMRRNQAQTCRNASNQTFKYKPPVNFEDHDLEQPEATEMQNHYLLPKTQISTPIASSTSRLGNSSSMAARAKLAEQQRLRQSQSQAKRNPEFLPQAQPIFNPNSSPFDVHESIKPVNSDLFYDPTEKTMEVSNLPELKKQTVLIRNLIQEPENHNPRQRLYEISQKSSLVSDDIYQPELKEEPIRTTIEMPVRAHREEPLKAPREPQEKSNEIFKSIKQKAFKFQDLPLDAEPENQFEKNENLDAARAKHEEKEETRDKSDDEVRSALSPEPTFEKLTLTVLKLNLKQQITDMRVFLTSPCPQGFRMQCSIRRDRSGMNRFYPKYHCLLSDGLQYMMTAKKRAGNRTSNYLIGYSQKDIKKTSPYCLGKLRSNFLGTEFNIYDTGSNPEKTRNIETLRTNLGAILYEENVISGGKGPRRKRVYIPEVDSSTGQQYQFKPLNGKDNLYYHWKSGKRNGIKELYNKKPTWSDVHQTHILDYGGRAQLSSIKNFQLIDQNDDRIFLQFGKVTENTYILDFEWPLSPFQAFAICLTSFDYKIACE